MSDAEFPTATAGLESVSTGAPRFHGLGPRQAAVAAGALTALFATWDAFRLGGERTTVVFTDVMSFVAPLFAGGACFLTGSQVGVERRRSWFALGAATLCWAAGQMVWTVYEVLLDRPVPFPSLADLGYMSMIPLAGLAIAWFPSAPRVRTSIVRAGLDGAFVAVSMLFVGWALVLGTVYKNAVGSTFEKTIGLAYPLGDLVLLTVLIITIGRTRPGVRHPLVLVGLGLVAITLSDSLFAVLTAQDEYVTGMYVDDGWFVGFLLIALAAVTRRRSTNLVALPEKGASRIAIVLPLVPVSLGIAVAMYKELAFGGLEPFLFWVAAFAVGIVVARQASELLDEKRLLAQLEAAYDRLQAVERQRVQLLNNVAHDIGTPLTPIGIQLHLLAIQDPQLPEDVRRSHQIIKRNTEHLRLLLADLLDVARMDAGRLKLVLQDMDLSDVLRGSIESMNDMSAERGIALRLETGGPMRLRADAGRLNQVVYNLLTNALKFTPRGGTIRVDAYPAGTMFRVDVTDTGRGLAPEETARLFQPFSQVHRPDEIKERGTGLGLYITKGIIEGHGGRVGVVSEGLGKGTTFTFTLPAP